MEPGPVSAVAAVGGRLTVTVWRDSLGGRTNNGARVSGV